jgi:phosphoglycolate phosphatase
MASDGRPGVAQTVVTGNVRANAELKLCRLGPGRASSTSRLRLRSPDRARLIKLARQRAAAARGWADGSAAVVIGDSPRDIHAARAAGARVIAVATGRTPLRNCGPPGPI